MLCFFCLAAPLMRPQITSYVLCFDVTADLLHGSRWTQEWVILRPLVKCTKLNQIEMYYESILVHRTASTTLSIGNVLVVGMASRKMVADGCSSCDLPRLFVSCFIERFVAQDAALSARNRKPLCLKELSRLHSSETYFVPLYTHVSRRFVCAFGPWCVPLYFLAANRFLKS